LAHGLRLHRTWLGVGATGLLDLVWCRAIGLSLTGAVPFVGAMGGFLLAAIILRAFDVRSRFAAVAETVALWLAFAHTDNLLSYLAATPALKLQDALLVRLDHILGFGWRDFAATVTANATAREMLSFCYDSMLPEIFLLGGFLAWTRRGERVEALFWIAFIASLLTCIVSALLPALGAFQQFGLPERGLHLDNLRRLRAGVDLRFAISDMQGVVSMPSYHTVLALLMAYVVRSIPIVFWPVALWSALMLVSIMPFGGHYFVDMAAGAIVLLCAIALFNKARTWLVEPGHRAARQAG
jgi:membrane-associated phospholipid phosphatase